MWQPGIPYIALEFHFHKKMASIGPGYTSSNCSALYDIEKPGRTKTSGASDEAFELAKLSYMHRVTAIISERCFIIMIGQNL